MIDVNELSKIRVKMHDEINNLRNMEHYIRQPYFENLWIVSDENQKQIVKKILEKKDKPKLIKWIRRHPSLELGEKNIRQLRDDAREAYIKNYSRMDKLELLMALKNYIKDPTIKTNLTNRDMILEIGKLTDEMSGLFLEAKIKEDYLLVDPEAVNFDISIITEAFDWIHEIHDKEYQKAKEIKMLLPDEMWIRYKSWGDFGDHKEVVLLNGSLQSLRKAVVNSTRPNLFKKSKIKSFLLKLAKRKES